MLSSVVCAVYSDHSYFQVDYTGHSWTFQTRWLQYLWGSHSPSWDAGTDEQEIPTHFIGNKNGMCSVVGEDVAFSALAWLKGRVRTIVPRMPIRDKTVRTRIIHSFYLNAMLVHILSIRTMLSLLYFDFQPHIF